MRANSYLQIDLSSIEQNIASVLRDVGPSVKVIPVLKGNAYGLGSVRIARFLSSLPEIDTFAVSHVMEGVELRDAGITEKIMVMSLPLDFQMDAAVEQDLILTLGSFRQFPLLADAARKTGRKIPVQLKLDTGLHRIGFLPDEIEELGGKLRDAASYLDITGTFSHFSCDDEAQLAKQGSCFRSCLKKLKECGIDPGLCHISSSGSLEASRNYLFDAVRIGRRLTLDSPTAPDGRIREAFSFRAFLADIKKRHAGETLAYGGKVILEKDTRVGVLSIGYGDGLDPSLAHVHAPVLVNGQRAKLLACCMDQSFVDLGSIDCEPGDEVTLYGHDGKGNLLSSQEVAALLGLEGCDLTTELTGRVERVYVN